MTRKLLYIDSSFALSQIRKRGLDHVLQIRFLEGLFDQVWSAHPVDTHPAASPGVDPVGPTLQEQLSADHVFVRGRYGRFRALTRIAPLNAFLALGSFVATLVGIVRREQIGVIRVGDPLLCGLLGLVIARLTGAKLVVRVNGDHDQIRARSGLPINPRLFRSATIEDRIERTVLKRADLVFVPSLNYRNFALRKGAGPDRIKIIRYGNLIDSRHMAMPAERGFPDDPALVGVLQERPWMVHVGRLLNIKYADDCYAVLRELAVQNDDVGLLLIGDGPLRETIRMRAKADGLAGRVRFLGNIEQSELARILPLCALALSPLTGRALAEVAFAALPIVAYDLDWQGEIVETDVTGVLVPGGDTAAMAQGAARLLSDAALRDHLGSEVRRRALELLDAREQTRREIEAYLGLGVLN